MELGSSLEAAVVAVCADATTDALEALDGHLGRAWGSAPGARLESGASPSDPFVVHRRTGPATWFPVGTHQADTSTAVEPGPALLAALDDAATKALGPGVDVTGLSAFAFVRVVAGDAGPGEIALADAQREAPDFQVGDELGRHEAAITARLRWAVVRELRARLPLSIADDETPRETVCAALEEAAAELGQTVAQLRAALVEDVGVPLATLDADTARLALDVTLKTMAPALAPLTPARAAALVAELGASAQVEAPREDETLALSEWEQARFDALQALDDDPRHAELEALAAHRNADPVWHVLAAHAQGRPEDLPHVETLLEAWSDGARLMPRAWLSSIQTGRFAPYHRLVRQLVLEGPEAALLHLPGVEASLGGLRGLGLRGLERPALERVFALRWLGELRELHLLDGPTLAATDAFPSVEQLQVHRGHHRPEDLAELIVAPSFPALAKLHLFGVGVGLGGLARALGERPLARAPFTLRLTSLPDAPGLARLLEAPAFASLGGLELIGIELEPRHAMTLAAAPLTLRALVLHQGELGPAGAEALAAAPWWNELEKLSLPSRSGCHDAGVATLIAAMAAPRHLELRHQQLGHATARELAEADLSTLEHLELSYNPLEDADLARVLRNPTLRALKRLSLLRTGAAEAALEAVAAGALPELEVLEVGDHVSDEAAAKLLAARLPRLRRLQLRGASSAAMKELADAGVHGTNAMFA